MSGGSYNYLYCKECHELFAYSNIRTLEEMESRFLELGYEDVAKDFRRLIEYIKSANNRVEVLGGQLNEMMHDIEWYDSGDIGADTLAKRVEKYRQADTPQTEETCERCVYVRGSQWCQGCNGTPKRWDGEKIVDTPQTKSCFNCDHYEPKGWCNLFADTVSPNYKCCSEFAEIKPYEYEIKALHKDYQEPYCEVTDTPQTERNEK